MMKTYAIRTRDGEYLAEQGGTFWTQDAPTGWAAFTDSDHAHGVARQAGLTEDEYGVVTVEGDLS